MGDNFSWSAKSAFNKAISNVTVTAGAGIGVNASISKQVTGPHNPEKDAYRACKNCGKHTNYHKDGKCPK